MARSDVDPLVRYAVLGVLGFVGWNWAAAQPAGSPYRHSIDQIRGWFHHPSLPGAPAPAQPAPSGGGGGGGAAGGGSSAAPSVSSPAARTAPAPGLTIIQQYNEQRADGWYQVTQWSDGSYTEAFIDPSLWTAYGIPGAPQQGPPAPPPAGSPMYGPWPVAWGPLLQKHDDGQWWVDTGYSDGVTTSQYVDPSQYSQLGVLPDGSGIDPNGRVQGAPINAVVDWATGLIQPVGAPADGMYGRVEGAPINALIDWLNGLLGGGRS